MAGEMCDATPHLCGVNGRSERLKASFWPHMYKSGHCARLSDHERLSQGRQLWATCGSLTKLVAESNMAGALSHSGEVPRPDPISAATRASTDD